MIRSEKIHAIVLKRISFGDADRILTLLSREHGKMVVVAKSIRKITSRKAPHVELFRHMEGYIVRGKGIPILIEAKTIHSFSRLQEDIEKVATAYRIVEEVERFLPENEPHDNIFEKILETFSILQNKKSPYTEISAHFTHYLLWDLGFLPHGKILNGTTIDTFVEDLLESRLKSRDFLTKVGSYV